MDGPDAVPAPPPPRRRLLDTVTLEGLEEFVDLASESRTQIKSRDFPELRGLDLQPMHVQVVLFDKYSVDSFAACFAARAALGDQAKYVGVDRSTTADELARSVDVNEKVIAMLGIYWTYEEMHCLLAECPVAVLVLENHASAAQELGPLSHDNLVIAIDPDMGAGAMAWNFFHPGQPVPLLLRYIEDMDVGREVLSGAAAFADGFEIAFSFKQPTVEQEERHWLCHFNDDAFIKLNKLIEDDGGRPAIAKAQEEGRALAGRIQEQGSQAFEKSEVKILRAFPAWRCSRSEVSLSTPSAGRIAEKLLEALAQQSDAESLERCLAVLYEVRGRFVRVVLRSLNQGPHVNEIGCLYGGCGHPRHAFFSVPLDAWEDLWAPEELVLWDVPSGGPSCLALSRGDLVTIARKGERFRGSPFEEWSWGLQVSPGRRGAVEGWVPSLAHTLFLASRSVPSVDEGVEGLEEGDLLVAWLERGEYLWGSKFGSCLTSALAKPSAWFPRDSGLHTVQANSVRELLGEACSSGVRGGA